MGKLIAVIKREYFERVRSKWFVVATVFGPLMMAVMAVLPAYLATKSSASADVANIVILDASDSELGARVSRTLGAFGRPPEVRRVAPSELAAAESTATRQVVDKTVQGYLVVDLVTKAGERARYAGRNASTLPDVDKIQDAVKTAVLELRFEAAGLDAQKVQALSTLKVKVDAERLTESGRGGGGKGNAALAYAVALLLYMSIVLYGQSILMGVIEEKSQRVAEVVVAAVPADTLLAGKVIGVGAVGLTQQLVWIASAIGLMRFQQPIMASLGLPATPINMPQVTLGTAVAYFCFYILGFVFFTSLFGAVGSMVSSTQDAQQVSTPLTMLIVPSILLLMPVLMAPNGGLARAVSIIPFTAPILMPVRMSLTSVPWYELAASIGLLLLSCAGAMWLAARIYRVGVLMYGKKPSFAEVARWVRFAR
ncbi:MAG: ABC transporter permease [Gemmatimonadetes bacterium]|nr:ABC transporter permease [Gemmatimonadota bacterium]